MRYCIRDIAALFFSSILGYSSIAAELRIQPSTPIPQSEVYTHWLNDFHEKDDFWMFSDKKDLINLLDTAHLDSAIKEHLLGLWTTGWDDSQSAVNVFLYGCNARGGLHLDEALLRQLPTEIFQKVYTYFKNHYIKQPRPRVVLGDLESMEQWIHSHFPDSLYSEIRRYVVYINDDYVLPIFRYTWQSLSIAERKKLINMEILDSEISSGLNVFLHLDPHEDVSRVANLYSSSRDPRILERFLKRQQNKGNLDIPLQSILPPFIRSKVATYSRQHGPNCFQAGVNAHCSKSQISTDLILEGDLVKAGLSQQHRFVAEPEPLETGDVLVAFNDEDELIHVAYYVFPYLVFSKNGLSRFNPYVFQWSDKNLDIYTSVERVQVYRKVEREQSIAQQTEQSEEVFHEWPSLANKSVCEKKLVHIDLSSMEYWEKRHSI